MHPPATPSRIEGREEDAPHLKPGRRGGQTADGRHLESNQFQEAEEGVAPTGQKKPLLSQLTFQTGKVITQCFVARMLGGCTMVREV